MNSQEQKSLSALFDIQVKRLISLVLLLSAPLGALAQEPDLRQAPPPIAFEPWKEVASDERTQEFAASFPSPVVTPHQVNNVVPLQILMPVHRQGPIPAVLVLHYWGAVDLRVERSIGYELNSRGIAAVIVALPYHLGRTPPGERSGSMAIQPDPEKLKATMRQCVLDVRRALDWVQSKPEFAGQKIGIVGTSLGSIVAALVSGIDSRLDSAAYVLGGIDLAHILWRSSRVVTEREKLRGMGFNEDRLREALAPIEPGRYLAQQQPRNAFVVVARYDTVVPPESGEKLIDVLGSPDVLRLDTGHYGGFFVQKRVHHEVALFFSKAFSNEDYKPPARISAPTVRIGVSLFPDEGLQVSAGIDIWRGDAGGTTFANLQIAPRGVQLFLGRRLDRGFSLGVFGTAEGLYPGLYWSIVL